MKRNIIIFLTALFAWSLGFPGTEHAGAAAITVTNALDDGPGTLRAALASAADGDTIDFSVALPATITLTNGELLVTNSVTITGPGALTIDGNNTSRVFHIGPSNTVALANLTITHGSAVENTSAGDKGGGIYNVWAALTISNCFITGNEALSGGGIANAGAGSGGPATVRILNSILSGNSANGGEGGAIYSIGHPDTTLVEVINSTLRNNSNAAYGGAIASYNSELVVTNSILVGNFATNGGAIINAAILGETGIVYITSSILCSNSAANSGGAILNGSDSGSATAEITNCTLNGNSAVSGGAVFNWVKSSASSEVGTVILNNCTLSDNAAPSEGGAILNQCDSAGSVVSCQILNCTLSGNFSQAPGGDLANESFNDGIVKLEIGNTILKSSFTNGSFYNNGGSIVSLGHNLCADPAGGDITTAPGGMLNAIGDQRNTDPLLDPAGLKNNGGLTATIALQAASPAIDKGTNFGFSIDQRGRPRPFDKSGIPNAAGGDGSDIGAYEVGPNLTTSITGAGTLVRNPDQVDYPANFIVILTANPNAGWTLGSWSGDASGSSNPLIVMMTSDKNITANFLPAYTLTTTINGGGIVNRSPDQAAYASNILVSLSAIPAVGYSFAGWSGDATGTQNPLSLLMTASKSVTANFMSGISDLIMDNTNATYTGFWTNTDGSGVGASGKYGPDFAYTATVSSSTATATFRPSLPLTGNYDVYVWFPFFSVSGKRCHDAEYTVSWNSANETVSVDQAAMGSSGQWQLIETGRQFAQGTNGFVLLSNQSTDTANRWVAADAVRWVWSTNQVTQPYITSITRGPSNATLTWLSDSNQVYRLQYKTNLTDVTWLDVSGDVPATASTAGKTDTTLSNAARRFYRVMLLP